MIVKTTDNKVIGTLDNGIFTKTVKGSVHKLLSPPAWAVDSYVFDHVLRGRCNLIVVTDIEDHGKKYSVLFKIFDANKKETNRKFGKQYFLTMDWWKT